MEDTAKPDVWLERCAQECAALNGHELVSFLHGVNPSLEAQQIDTILWDYCQRFQATPPTDGVAAGSVGVFSIEGTWPSREFVQAAGMLRVWTRSCGVSLTREAAATVEELFGHLRSWSETDTSYGVLYLRFPRSDSDGVLLNSSGGAAASVSLDEVASCIEQSAYSNENCIVHFGSCLPKSATTEDLERFLERTGFAGLADTQAMSIGPSRWRSIFFTLSVLPKPLSAGG